MIICIPKLLSYFFWVIFLYSFYWGSFGRVGGLPIAYLPFLALFLVFVVIALFRGKAKIHRSDVFVFLAMGYFLIQPLLLKVQSHDFVGVEYLKDMIMHLVYFASYVSLASLTSKINVYEKMKLIDQSLSLLVAATMIGFVRFVIIDPWVGSTDFFNITPVLQYRFFEVMLFAYGFAVSTYSYLEYRIKKYKYFALLFIFAMILTGSRTGILVVLFSIIIIYMRGGYPDALKIDIKWFIQFSVFVFLVVISNLIIGGDIYDRLSRIGEVNLFASLNLDGAIEEKKNIKRILYLTGGMQMFANYPLFGVGLGNFQEGFPRDLLDYVGLKSAMRPHNMYVSYLATAGGIGAFLFFGWFFSLWRELKSKATRAEPAFRFLCNCTFLFLSSMFVLFLGYEVETNPVFWGLLGICMGLVRWNEIELHNS